MHLFSLFILAVLPILLMFTSLNGSLLSKFLVKSSSFGSSSAGVELIKKIVKKTLSQSIKLWLKFNP